MSISISAVDFNFLFQFNSCILFMLKIANKRFFGITYHRTRLQSRNIWISECKNQVNSCKVECVFPMVIVHLAPMRNSDQMTIGKMQPTLPFRGQKFQVMDSLFLYPKFQDNILRNHLLTSFWQFFSIKIIRLLNFIEKIDSDAIKWFI